jgi:hypothetical protein
VAIGTAQLRVGLDRLVFLLIGSDGKALFEGHGDSR